MKKLIIVLILFLINNLHAEEKILEITVPLNIYDQLSKTTSVGIIGSSKTIITRKDIKKYKDYSIHEIIGFEAGIKNRSIYGSNSSGNKTTLDIRGMGAQAKSNVLILINGQRLNNIDMSEIDFPSIPIESIDRIEIYKGTASSVLYGEGAIGGTINIITLPNQNNSEINSFLIGIGSYNKKKYSFQNSQEFTNYNIYNYFTRHESDGYRDENEQQQNNFTSEIFFPNYGYNNFLTFSFSEQIMSTPSDRSQDELYNDRRGSDTPDDYITSEGGSLLFSTSYDINKNKKFFFNSSFRQKNSFSDLQTSASYPSYNETYLNNYQITPRISESFLVFGKKIKSNYGIDIQYADYKSKRKKNAASLPLHIYSAWQSNQSAYAQQVLTISKNTNLGLGLRAQRNEIEIDDILNTAAPNYNSWDKVHVKFTNNKINYASNIGLEHKLNEKIKLFGRLSSGFRYPNIDDRIGGSGDTSFDLKTQTTTDYEIGSNLKMNIHEFNFSTYLIYTKNELGYDSDNFVNINVNSTRRYGFELNSKHSFSNNILFINNFTFTKAKYTSGDQGSYASSFKDKDVPLVPQFSLDSSLDLDIFDSIQIKPSIKFQDDMRMESDDENFQNTKIPGYTIANLNISKIFKNFNFSLGINNLLNHKYFNYAVASSGSLGIYNAYPEAGREISISIQSNF